MKKYFKSLITSVQVDVFFVVAVGAVICFLASGDWWLSGIIVLAVIIYLGIIFFLASIRRDTHLPDLEHSIWIFLFLFLIVLFGFANMYVKSCEIVDSNVSSKKEYSNATVNKCDRAGVLKDEYDAIYYSLVTLTTTGYGDYLPMEKWGRQLVISQLFASALLIAGGLAFLISRLASREGSEVATSENLKEILKKRTFKLADNTTFVFVHLDNQNIDFLDTDGKWKVLTDQKKLEEAKKKLNEQTT